MSDCIFCKIRDKQISSELIHETQDFFVIKDIAPKADIHNLIIPKKHIESLLSLSDDDRRLVGEMIGYTRELAGRYGLTEKGYKVEINTGPEGGQEVMHLHLHFLAGTRK